jgi:NifU-like protein involved in Fe-S cluster formation
VSPVLSYKKRADRMMIHYAGAYVVWVGGASRTNAFLPNQPDTIFVPDCVLQLTGTVREQKNMLDEVYNRRILELAGDIPRLGRLEKPDASATAHSKLCGSTVTIDLAMQGGKVVDFAHEVRACALGQASSSIMARNVIGASAAELREVRSEMRKMLKENGMPPQGKWADLKVLEPVRNYHARHASTLLTFDAVVDAIDQIEGKPKQAVG